MTVIFDAQEEISSQIPIDLERVKAPHFSRFLEDYMPGQVFVHPRGYTFSRAQMDIFARTYMQTNPVYLNVECAKAHGFNDMPASPQMVFNVVLSLGVQNDSEKVVANLGYYNTQFLAPVYPGDTVEAITKVISREEKGNDRPGIVTIRTVGINQRHRVVLQFERKLMVQPKDQSHTESPRQRPDDVEIPWVEPMQPEFPDFVVRVPAYLTGRETYVENFSVGDIIAHTNGRTITDEHLVQTYQVGNTHALHFDQLYSESISGSLGGSPVVFGGLVFAWLEGLASRDVSENAVWELGFTEGYHTQPTFSGDTLYCVSRVLSVEPAPGDLNDLLGVVTFQLIGVKNISAYDAVHEFRDELFIKEKDKKNMGLSKIENKVFEIERRLLIKKRPYL